MVNPHLLWQQKVSQLVQVLLLETMQRFGQVTLPRSLTFLKELQSTILNSVLVMVERLLVLLVTRVSSKHELATKSEFECHLDHSVNFLQTAVQQSAFLPDTDETKCLCELQVLLTTRRRLVVSCSRTSVVLQ
jgi:hypothetical protein